MFEGTLIEVAKTKDLSPEEFTLLRRDYLGASDSSVILGVNPFSHISDLKQQKLSTKITAEERAIGRKVNVRKGSDLEPLILQKFIDKHDIEIIKPDAMYSIEGYPYMAVNFDGVGKTPEGRFFPVEAKFVSAYGGKHWDEDLDVEASKLVYMREMSKDIQSHIKQISKLYGMPPYYYTQLQYQIFALDAEFGYIAALFDKTWELNTYFVKRDPTTIVAMMAKYYHFYEEVQREKRNQADKV